MPELVQSKNKKTNNQTGYSFVELLVVVSVVSILGIVGYVNYKNFSRDQVVNKAVRDIQTVLRLAQSNATSSTLCGTSPGVSWAATFNFDQTSINLVCGSANTLQKTYTLINSRVDQIQGSACGSFSTFPFSIYYSSRLGAITLSDTSDCMNASPYLTFTIKNTKDTSAALKTFKLSKGGAIDVQ